MPSKWPLLLFLLAVAGAAPLHAQEPAPGGSATRDPLRLQALIGTVPAGDHLAGGALLGWGQGGWSVQALGMVGGGGEYGSRLFAGAAGRRLFVAGPVEVSALLGAGTYGEDGASEIRRSAIGPFFGARAEMAIGGAAVALLVTDLAGRYGGDDVREPFGFHAVRFTLGVGF